MECQSPLFLTIETEQADGDAPSASGSSSRRRRRPRPPAASPESCTRASTGSAPAEILAVPDDMPELLGLTRAITPLRMRGMTAMLGRIKRKVVASGDRQPSAQS